MTTTRITTPFDWSSTAADVVRDIDLTGRRAIVTGGASGIGVETARALVSAGAAVTLAVRDLDAGRRVAADIGGADVARLDLADIASVDAFVRDWTGPLDVLVNNAGVMAISTLRRTPEGRELQFATNHLGHFQLALGLHDALAAAGNARIVSVSSSGNLASPVMFDDPDFRTTPYDPWVAYGQAKTANVLFAVGATNRWAADGIVANALHPGMIETNLGRHMDADTVAFHRERAAAIRTGGGNGLKTPQQGAMTSVVLATWPGLDGIGGRYFEDGNEAEVVDPSLPQTSDPHGVAAYALDPDNADRLWGLSLDMLAAR